MKTVIFFLAVVLASSSFAQKRLNVTMEVDSVMREFIVSLPSGDEPIGGYPVVFMLHGTSGDGEKFYNVSGWKEKGEAEKFVTVFPSSLRYCVTEDSAAPHMTTKWNNGDLQEKACPGQTFKDDVKFFRMMVDTIKKSLPIDASRIYASGFSNGGCMVSKLAVEASDIIAAVGASAGPLTSPDSGTALRMIPIVFSVGTLDDRYYELVGRTSLPFNDTGMFVLRGLVNRYLDVFHLGEEYTKDSTALSIRYRFNTQAVAASWEFNYVLFNGLEHNYPNGTNFPVAASDFLWTFFQQYTLPLSVKKSGEEMQSIYIRPNPTTDYIIIDEDATLTLFAPTGTEVFSKSVLRDERIALPKLASGVYIAKIETKSGVKSAKVVVQ